MWQFKIKYYDKAGNPLQSRDFADFCALECDGNLLDYFATEDACMEALVTLQFMTRNPEVTHDVR